MDRVEKTARPAKTRAEAAEVAKAKAHAETKLETPEDYL